MNLAEIKKLKVADLRAKLQERGLDSKGLKADLVERLMSAIEAESQGIRHNKAGVAILLNSAIRFLMFWCHSSVFHLL
uniref:SAP domain-containing protein n=1 Tax=Paramormyrops kingsleyae TaxID=1676925 RepID=A0A3B3Q799_9TELE